MGKFKPGDRVVLHSIPKKDQDKYWYNGSKATVQTEARGESGYVPKELGLPGVPSYGVYFDDCTYEQGSVENWHTPSEAILELDGEFEAELNAAIESIKAAGVIPLSPEERVLRAKLADAWEDGFLVGQEGGHQQDDNPYREEK